MPNCGRQKGYEIYRVCFIYCKEKKNMRVYRGTMTKGKNRKSSSKSAAGGSFMRFVTVVCSAAALIAMFGGIFLYYMSLVQQIRNTDQLINSTEQQIADTHRALQSLSNEYARLSRYSHIKQKIAQFRLPLTLAHSRQVRQKNMEILTPLQASMITYPVRTVPVSVAGNLPQRRAFQRRY